MRLSWIVITLMFLTFLKGYAQDPGPDFLNLEFEFGAGYAQSVDHNLFNDQQGIDPGGGVGINMAFRYHFDYNYSLGIHLILLADEIRDYDPGLVLGFNSERNLSFTNVNLGVNGKYTFNLRRWQPHVTGGLGVALGSMTNLDFEEPVNEFTGIALKMGAGIGYMVSHKTMLSVSVIRNEGVSWWKYYPSAESINKQFNPGFWMITLNVSVFFGDEDI